MLLIHIKHPIGRRYDAILTVSQKQRMKVVDYLRDICHYDLVAVIVKNIECKRGNHGVADRVLLLEKERASARARSVRMPAAPLIYNELYMLFGSVCADYIPISANDLVHFVCLKELLCPFFLCEGNGVSRASAIIMHCKAVDLL